MRISVLLLFVCAALTAWAQNAPVNLCPNGDFEKGVEGWKVLVVNPTDGTRAWHDEYITLEAKDTAPAPAKVDAKPVNSAGALKVVLKDLPAKAQTNQTGLLLLLNTTVPTAESDLLVTFWAKLQEPAAANLQIGRTWGGGASDPVNLTNAWKQYKVYVPIICDTPELLFSLIEPSGEWSNIHTTIAGTLLLDNVTVTAIPKVAVDPANLVKNGAFEAGTYGWVPRFFVEEPRAVTIAWDNLAPETKDLPKTGAKSLGAAKLTFANLPGPMCSHNSGLVAPLTRAVKKDEGDIKVTFAAKLLSPEKACLQVSRMFGGGSPKPLPLTRDWATYEVIVPNNYDTGQIVFALVPADADRAEQQPVIEGVVLLDNVMVTVVPRGK